MEQCYKYVKYMKFWNKCNKNNQYEYHCCFASTVGASFDDDDDDDDDDDNDDDDDDDDASFTGRKTKITSFNDVITSPMSQIFQYNPLAWIFNKL